MAPDYRNRIIVGLVAHQRLRGDPPARLIAGLEGCSGQRLHGRQIALQALTDRLALPAHLVLLALAALLLQPQVEGLPGRELRDRHHEIAAAVTNQPFHIAFLVPLARAGIAVADHVMRQESAEQRGTLARAVWQDFRHKAAIVVVNDGTRHRAEEREGMNVSVNPSLRHCRRIGPHIAGITVRQIEREKVGLLLHPADLHQSFPEIGLRIACRVRQRHEHLPAALLALPDIILDDRIAAGETMLGAQTVEYPLRRMALLARDTAIPLKPSIDDPHKPVQLRAQRCRLTP